MTMSTASKTRVEGENGLVIQLDRGKIKYAIENKNLSIEIENGIGEISLFSGSIKKWFPPFSDVRIDELEKQRIINNVVNAMKLLGVKCVVE